MGYRGDILVSNTRRTNKLGDERRHGYHYHTQQTHSQHASLGQQDNLLPPTA